MDDTSHHEWFDQLSVLANKWFDRQDRPYVIVSYAQSVDGSIATRNREQLQLSSHESMVLTHRIRASCDAIVIGINTLLIDDPQLTVRLIRGRNPQPIVLDSKLRTPLQSRILDRTDYQCWLACTEMTDPATINNLENRGADIIPCRADSLGRVDLMNLLDQLGKRGIRSIMVEGGGQVITSFIEAQLVDQLIVTVAPRMVGGLPVLNGATLNTGHPLQLDSVSYQTSGPDLIIWGQPYWNELEP